jgi:iron complex outermembrane receptor protein
MNNSRIGLPTGGIFATAIGLSLATSGIVHAQTARTAVAAETAPLEEVVVTGTSIKGLNAETALPVQVLKREDIERTGATTAEELFRTISAASGAGSVQTAQQSGTNTGALSAISLRGLGSGRTLVLIDGRRSAVYGGGSTGAAGNSVDISAIPLAAIERVEILKDGASAIYGSDAIAGVVNFILRSDYQGLEVTALAGTPTRDGGGASETFSALGGMGDLKTDKYNVSLGVNYYHQGSIFGASRSFAGRYQPQFGNDNTSSFAFPGNVSIPKTTTPATAASTQNPRAGNCGTGFGTFTDQFFPTQCRFDNSSFDSLQPEQKKISENLDAHLAIGEDTQLYVEQSFSQTKTITQVQPVPLSNGNPMLPGDPYVAFLANLLAKQYPTFTAPNYQFAPPNLGLQATGAFLLPPSSPYYPTAFAAAHGQAGQPLNIIYRDFANGLREEEDVSNALRVVGGIKGNVLGWDYDAGLLYSEVKVHEDLLTGFPLYSKIMPLLDSGTINPFGPTADPAALAAAKGDEFVGQDFASKSAITSLNGTASRSLVALPAGNLTGAVGGEIRRETFTYDPAFAMQIGDIAGQGGNVLPEDRSRTVESAFFELNAPIIQGLDVDAAVRYDHYQGVGGTFNPKASVKWQPTSWVLLRGAIGTGFRAPSLTDLFAGQASSVTGNGTRDPIQCATFNASNSACSFQFTTITGGNPDLKPEKSTSYTFGTVFEPIKNMSIDLDSFWIFLKNQIVVGGIPYTTFLANAANATQYASFINRDAGGNIVSISQINENLFKTNVSGLDMNFRYALDLPQGRLSLLSSGTYYYKYAIQNANGSWTGQLDQGLNTVGYISRFRYNATLMYDIHDFSVSMTQNFQKKYKDSAGSITRANREVSAYDTVDAQVNWNGLKQFRFTLGARNLFDKNPPYANYAGVVNNFVGGYDLSYGDPVGRFVYASATFYLK